MTENKVALKNMTEEELKEFLKSIGEKPFRGTQIFSWIYKGAKTFDDMNNIPKSLREKLEKVSYIGNIKQELVLESKVDKIKNAYPAYYGSYNNRGDIINYLDKYRNIYFVGRAGQHQYIDMDKAMITGLSAAKSIIEGDNDKKGVWL